jgi:hypothetical protein
MIHRESTSSSAQKARPVFPEPASHKQHPVFFGSGEFCSVRETGTGRAQQKTAARISADRGFFRWI